MEKEKKTKNFSDKQIQSKGVSHTQETITFVLNIFWNFFCFVWFFLSNGHSIHKYSNIVNRLALAYYIEIYMLIRHNLICYNFFLFY